MKKRASSVEPGSVFRLGAHVLACGDSRDAATVARSVGSLRIKAVISDPPYGVAATESKEGFRPLAKNKKIENDHLQSDAEYREFTRAWAAAVVPHLAAKNSFHVFNADKMVFALREGLRDAGVRICQLLVWVKTHAVVGRLDYAPQHELIAYGWHGTHEFLKAKDKSVLAYPKPGKSPFHPTTKPVPLVRHLVLNATRLGDAVFDGFLGSGTTLLACQQTGRVCVGIESDPEYCATAIERFERLTGVKAERA